MSTCYNQGASRLQKKCLRPCNTGDTPITEIDAMQNDFDKMFSLFMPEGQAFLTRCKVRCQGQFPYTKPVGCKRTYKPDCTPEFKNEGRGRLKK